MLGRSASRFAAAMFLGSAVACSGVTDNDRIPPEVRDPATARTPAGAMALYRGALVQFGRAVNSVTLHGGVLTDELVVLGVPLGFTMTDMTPLDTRFLPEDVVEASDYAELHAIRTQAQEARGFLTDYAPDSSAALRGMLYAAEGYAEIFLADLFCSGIPLSTLDYGADFTLRPGSTTEAVYRHAVALFDTAYALSADSARFQSLAAIGRARAQLALGDYAAAAASVAGVPDGFVYGFVFNDAGPGSALRLWKWSTPDPVDGDMAPTMASGEGHNGLDYRSSGDPRTAYEFRWTNAYGDSMFIPLRYQVGAPATLPVASGIEADMIRAEAALHAGSTSWIDILNGLRTDGTVAVTPSGDDPAALDSTWNAGKGGVAGLAPLTDPGTARARQDLLFRERAFWLYLSGQRQGDLRRLIRNYGRDANEVYPVGNQYKGATGIYGQDVTVPVPKAERQYNPHYDGCFHRNA